MALSEVPHFRGSARELGEVDLDGPGALPEGAISLELTATSSTFTFIVTPIGAAATTAIGSGTYTLSGSTITFNIIESSLTETVPVGTDTLAFRISGNRLTLEDDEKRFVYDQEPLDVAYRTTGSRSRTLAASRQPLPTAM